MAKWCLVKIHLSLSSPTSHHSSSRWPSLRKPPRRSLPNRDHPGYPVCYHGRSDRAHGTLLMHIKRSYQFVFWGIKGLNNRSADANNLQIHQGLCNCPDIGLLWCIVYYGSSIWPNERDWQYIIFSCNRYKNIISDHLNHVQSYPTFYVAACWLHQSEPSCRSCMVPFSSNVARQVT